MASCSASACSAACRQGTSDRPETCCSSTTCDSADQSGLVAARTAGQASAVALVAAQDLARLCHCFRAAAIVRVDSHSGVAVDTGSVGDIASGHHLVAKQANHDSVGLDVVGDTA